MKVGKSRRNKGYHLYRRTYHNESSLHINNRNLSKKKIHWNAFQRWDQRFIFFLKPNHWSHLYNINYSLVVHDGYLYIHYHWLFSFYCIVEDNTEKKRCYTKHTKVSSLLQNLKIVSYIVRNLKKFRCLQRNRNLSRFRRKSTKLFKKLPRPLTIILKVS